MRRKEKVEAGNLEKERLLQDNDNTGGVVKLLGAVGSIVLVSLVLGAALFMGGSTVSFKKDSQAKINSSN